MKLLCIDTTREKAVLCLNNEGKKLYYEIDESKKHSEALLFELENFLCNNKLTIQDIDCLGSITGPGSFTGIRIGMATVKAFSFALGLPIVSTDFFSCVSGYVKNGCVALKDTSNAVYFVEVNNGVCSEIEIVENKNLMEKVGKNNLYVLGEAQFVDATAYKNIKEISNYDEIMLNFLTKKAEQKEYTSSTDFAPTYAQLSQAEKNLKDKNGN